MRQTQKFKETLKEMEKIDTKERVDNQKFFKIGNWFWEGWEKEWLAVFENSHL